MEKKIVYEMSVSDENLNVEEDLLSGRAMEILLAIMNNCKTTCRIANKVSMSQESVRLYLDELVKAKLIKEVDQKQEDEIMDIMYELASNNLDIINRINETKIANGEKRRKSDLAIQNFSNITKKALKDAQKKSTDTNVIRTSFIKAKKEDMEQFSLEINSLFDKYAHKENFEAEEIYNLIVVFGPYDDE